MSSSPVVENAKEIAISNFMSSTVPLTSLTKVWSHALGGKSGRTSDTPTYHHAMTATTTV